MARPIGQKDKIRRKFADSFARQYLEDHKIQIYCGEEQILKPINEKLYTIKIPRTKYQPGELYIQEGMEIAINSAEELKEMGWVIISERIEQNRKWEKRQQIQYTLKKYSDTNITNIKIPKNHFVKYNTATQQVQLWGPRAGPSGYGPWIGGKKEINKEIKTKREKRFSELITTDPDLAMKKQLMKWNNIEEEIPEKEIPEAAIMITRNNEIICLPNDLNDMPSMIINGLKRSGKSFSSHSIIDRLFWKNSYNYKIAILNDSSREINTWTRPNQNEEQIYDLNKLNEKPLPLPLVFLHPKDIEDYPKYFMGNVGFDITLPFKTVIKQHDKYLNLGDSSIYFTKLIKHFLECKTEKEVYELLDTKKLTKEHDIPSGTAKKIIAQINTLLKSKMTDISTKKQDPWKINNRGEKEYNPITACVHAGVIPVLQTSHLSSDSEKLSIYFTHFVNDLFQRQVTDEDFLEEQTELFLVIDEAHNIANNKKNTAASQLLQRCVKEGGPRRVGTMIINQRFSELPTNIKNNTTYLICFKNPGESNDIANTYKLGKHAAKEITNLAKHECLAWTSEYFIIYDSNGNKRKSNLNEIFIGKTLPPYSTHKIPGK